MVTPGVWLGVAVGLLLVLVGAYVAYLEARVRALEEAQETNTKGPDEEEDPAGEQEA